MAEPRMVQCAKLGREAEGHPVILHCFSMVNRVSEVVERGYMTSFAGQLTYNSAADLQAAAREIPPELLLVETDAPYLSPVPDDIDRLTSANAGRIFGWSA